MAPKNTTTLFKKIFYGLQNRPALLHLLAWGVFIIYVFFLNFLSEPTIKLTQVIAFLFPMAVSFYTCLYCFRLFHVLGRLKTIPILIGSFVLLMVAGYLYAYVFLPSVGVILYSSKDLAHYLQRAFISYIQFLVYALVLHLVQVSFKRERSLRLLQEARFLLEKEKNEKELEHAVFQQEKLQLEFAILRDQISPHFLHNTLNGLFAQALPFSEQLADSIIKVSQLMRYATETIEAKDGLVDARMELRNLQTLIDIHRLRFGEALQVQFAVTGTAKTQVLPPLSLITIVENAFKFGDIQNTAHPVIIKAVMSEDGFYFYCHNRKKAYQDDSPHTQKIGLHNVNKRMNLLFRERCIITIENEPETYTYELTINA